MRRTHPTIQRVDVGDHAAAPDDADLDDAEFDGADLDDDADDADDSSFRLDDVLLKVDGDHGLDPFSVAFAGLDIDVLRVADAMLDRGAFDAPAADRRHRVRRHPATRRPGRH